MDDQMQKNIDDFIYDVKKMNQLGFTFSDIGGRLAIQFGNNGQILFLAPNIDGFTFQKQIEFDVAKTDEPYQKQFDKLYEQLNDLQQFVNDNNNFHMLERLYSAYCALKEQKYNINTILFQQSLFARSDRYLVSRPSQFEHNVVEHCANHYQRNKVMSFVKDKIDKLGYFDTFKVHDNYPSSNFAVKHLYVTTKTDNNVVCAECKEDLYNYPNYSIRTVLVTLNLSIENMMFSSTADQQIEDAKQMLMECYKMFNLVDVVNLLPNNQSVVSLLSPQFLSTKLIEQSVEEICNMKYHSR